MEKTFTVNVYTPTKTIFQGEIVSLTAPGTVGSFGVLANHTPFISSLVPGKVVLRAPAGKSTIIQSIGKGFFEVSHNKAAILLHAVEENTNASTDTR